jgi:hypothetical protein
MTSHLNFLIFTVDLGLFHAISKSHFNLLCNVVFSSIGFSSTCFPFLLLFAKISSSSSFSSWRIIIDTCTCHEYPSQLSGLWWMLWFLSPWQVHRKFTKKMITEPLFQGHKHCLDLSAKTYPFFCVSQIANQVRLDKTPRILFAVTDVSVQTMMCLRKLIKPLTI